MSNTFVHVRYRSYRIISEQVRGVLAAVPVCSGTSLMGRASKRNPAARPDGVVRRLLCVLRLSGNRHGQRHYQHDAWST
jgi:hypothetical protein